MNALLAHLQIKGNRQLSDCDAFLEKINRMLAARYRITHSTTSAPSIARVVRGAVIVAREKHRSVPVDDRHDRPRETFLMCAAAVRSCDASAYVSTSVREKPCSVAMRSAEMPCGTKPTRAPSAGSTASGMPDEPSGTRERDSTPPPIANSASPKATFSGHI